MITHRRGHGHSREVRPHHDFAKFSQKLHEIENICPRGVLVLPKLQVNSQKLGVQSPQNLEFE